MRREEEEERRRREEEEEKRAEEATVVKVRVVGKVTERDLSNLYHGSESFQRRSI